MSYIFISYSHHDLGSLYTLIQFLKDNGFESEYWYDTQIEAGKRWIPEIDTHLEKAYAMVVIVTPRSMESHYVNYEWSSAIGSGTVVIPLMMDGDYANVHAKLLDIQVIDARTNIPVSFIDALKAARVTQPEINFLNQSISNILMRLRVAILITFWAYGQLKSTNEKFDYDKLIYGMLNEAGAVSWRTLPDFMTSRSSGFTKKQLRTARELTIAVEAFWYIFNNAIPKAAILFPKAIRDVTPEAIDFWAKSLAPLIEFFHTESRSEIEYDILASTVDAIEKKETSITRSSIAMSTDVIDRTFGKKDEYGKLLKQTIQTGFDNMNHTL